MFQTSFHFIGCSLFPSRILEDLKILPLAALSFFCYCVVTVLLLGGSRISKLYTALFLLINAVTDDRLPTETSNGTIC